jgi:Rhs element Vgr protein
VNGEDLSPVASISLSQDVHRHHNFEIALATDAFRQINTDMVEKSKRFIGQELHLAFGSELFSTTNPDHEFTGVVTEVAVNRFDNGDRGVTLRGHSPTIMLEGLPQCRSFTDKTIAEIVDATLENVPHSLKTLIDPTYKESFLYVVQYQESNYAFLQRVAATVGDWCYYDGTQLVFGNQRDAAELELPLVKDLFTFDFSYRLQPTRTKDYSYDYLTNEVFSSRSQEASPPPLDPYGEFALEQSRAFYQQESVNIAPSNLENQDALDHQVRMRQNTTTADMVQMHGNSDNPHLAIGAIVNITGEAATEHDHGKYIITAVSHHISGTRSYQNSFTAVPADVQLPPPPYRPHPRIETQRAEVTDNNDPDKIGRVKVKFPWQEGSETTPWIRIIQPYAGKGERGGLHGFHFIPEIGTEVLVGFEHNQPVRPFVLGNVYHGESKPEPWASSSNSTKIIRTRNGNEIRLVDSGGKEKIHIYHRKDEDHYNEIRLEMEGEGTITIETKGQLNFKAKNIKMLAEENIVMGAQDTIEMVTTTDPDNFVSTGEYSMFKMSEGIIVKALEDLKANATKGSVDVASDLKDVSVKATGKVALESTQDMTLDALNLEMKANISLTAEGKMDASLKSLNATVSGDATTTVKGGIVKIN